MVKDILQALPLKLSVRHHHSPVKMQRKISSIQQLLLEGLFFKESLRHKGSSQIHFPLAHIKETEILLICETSDNPVYVIGEKVKYSTFYLCLGQVCMV